MKKNPNGNVWIFAQGIKPKENLHDPRRKITHHMQWQNLKIANHAEHSRWNGIEPDNYNFGIWYERPVFIDGISDQVWFKDSEAGWMSMYVINEYTRPHYDVYLREQPWWAHWRAKNPHPIRPRMTRIDYDHQIYWAKNAGRTEDERLFDLGFYDKLQDKGVTADWIRQRVGEPQPYNIDEDYDDEEL